MNNFNLKSLKKKKKIESKLNYVVLHIYIYLFLNSNPKTKKPSFLSTLTQQCSKPPPPSPQLSRRRYRLPLRLSLPECLPVCRLPLQLSLSLSGSPASSCLSVSHLSTLTLPPGPPPSPALPVRLWLSLSECLPSLTSRSGLHLPDSPSHAAQASSPASISLILQVSERRIRVSPWFCPVTVSPHWTEKTCLTTDWGVAWELLGVRETRRLGAPLVRPPSPRTQVTPFPVTSCYNLISLVFTICSNFYCYIFIIIHNTIKLVWVYWFNLYFFKCCLGLLVQSIFVWRRRQLE